MPKASVALEVQPPYGQLIADKIKSIETRRYNLPPELLHQPMYLLQSTKGIEGVSALLDEIDENSDNLVILGEIIVDEVFQYTSMVQYNEDRHLHCVPIDSNYNYVEGCELYGWRIGSLVKYEKEIRNPKLKRLMRSLFTVLE